MFVFSAQHYPFYAVQWHPEKSQFEWVDKPGMVHATQAVRASFYTASFFVAEGECNAELYRPTRLLLATSKDDLFLLAEGPSGTDVALGQISTLPSFIF